MCKEFKNGVPTPWCPMRTEENRNGCTAEVWGRTYKLENNLLFSSVTSLGDELLLLSEFPRRKTAKKSNGATLMFFFLKTTTAKRLFAQPHKATRL